MSMSSYGMANVVDDVHVLSWDDVDVLVKALAGTIVRDSPPSLIVGISRGGLIPAVMIAHAIGSRAVRSMTISRTLTDGVNAAKSAEPVISDRGTLGEVTGLDVLLVDDIAGSGGTLASGRGLLAASGAARTRAAVLRLNTANWHCGNREPDYVGNRAEGWVVFPWER